MVEAVGMRLGDSAGDDRRPQTTREAALAKKIDYWPAYSGTVNHQVADSFRRDLADHARHTVHDVRIGCSERNSLQEAQAKHRGLFPREDHGIPISHEFDPLDDGYGAEVGDLAQIDCGE